MAGILSLIPLFILFGVVAAFAYFGYQMFLWSNELADRGKKNLEKKNLSFTDNGGLRVGVKGLSNEDYADKTQNVLVNTWNNAAFPNYKSRLGWNSTQGGKSSPSASPRPGPSRENSDRSRSSATRASNPSLQAPDNRGSAKRSTSPLPGGWD